MAWNLKLVEKFSVCIVSAFCEKSLIKSDLLYADAIDCSASPEGAIGGAILWRPQRIRNGLASWQESAPEVWSCQHILENICLVFRFYKQNGSLCLTRVISFLPRPGLTSIWEVEVFPLAKLWSASVGTGAASLWHVNVNTKITLNLIKS